MEGYLLDSNAVSHWYEQKPAMVARVNALDENAQVRISAITLGELEFGHCLHAAKRDLVKRDEFADWVNRKFPRARTIDVTRHTRETYGAIRAAIFEKYPPRSDAENHLEKCYDTVTASELGIDENDLWIAAQAIERGLILITHDNMERIKEVAESATKWKFHYEDWNK